MAFDIDELYEYASGVRRRFLETLTELPWEAVERNREASHYSMKNILVHMIQNEEWMVNWVIRGRSLEYIWAPYETFTSLELVRRELDDVEGRTRGYLRNATAEELSRRVTLALRSGERFDLAVEECLLQSFTEQVFHLGELIALLWQEGKEPPKMQWFYNNPRRGRMDAGKPRP
jgi:uncharacterized damage-inducible protein DinB